MTASVANGLPADKTVALFATGVQNTVIGQTVPCDTCRGGPEPLRALPGSRETFYVCSRCWGSMLLTWTILRPDQRPTLRKRGWPLGRRRKASVT